MANIKREIGDIGENYAKEFLTKKGYTILDCNFRVKSGEIDIVAFQRGCIVFVEVKTRKNDSFYEAREAVNKSKQEKIRKAAREYIATKKISYREVRFDVIEYYTQNNLIEHYIDAF